MPPARPLPLPAAPAPGPFTLMPIPILRGTPSTTEWVVDRDQNVVLRVTFGAGSARDPDRIRKRKEWLLHALNTAWAVEENRRANERAYGPGGTAP